jgi:hypothetical protein
VPPRDTNSPAGSSDFDTQSLSSAGLKSRGSFSSEGSLAGAGESIVDRVAEKLGVADRKFNLAKKAQILQKERKLDLMQSKEALAAFYQERGLEIPAALNGYVDAAPVVLDNRTRKQPEATGLRAPLYPPIFFLPLLSAARCGN